VISVSLIAVAGVAADKAGTAGNNIPTVTDQITEHNHFFPPNPAGGNVVAAMVDETWEDLAGQVIPAPTGREVSSESLHLNPAPLAGNLTYHGGDVINSARLVCIFWGPTWASGGSDNARATNIQAFRDQFGTNLHYATITQYTDSMGAISTANLHGSQPDWFDTTNALPSSGNVTDSIVRQEVSRYLSHFGLAPNNATIYEVFLPRTVPGSSTLVFSSSGSSTSCGGPSLAYCAYHSNFLSGSSRVKYSIEPYPSCTGCQVSGWTVVQNMEHFVTHETREAVTDPLGSAWFDASGEEADDKCAWTGLFLENGFGYQPEWSNRVSGCVP